MPIKMSSAIGCIVLMMIALTGCKWNDDFRSRIHPQHQEQQPEPTFNEDSDDYVGDEIAKGQKPHDPQMEAIDELSEIPELPDRPTSMD